MYSTSYQEKQPDDDDDDDTCPLSYIEVIDITVVLEGRVFLSSIADGITFSICWILGSVRLLQSTSWPLLKRVLLLPLPCHRSSRWCLAFFNYADIWQRADSFKTTTPSLLVLVCSLLSGIVSGLRFFFCWKPSPCLRAMSFSDFSILRTTVE